MPRPAVPSRRSRGASALILIVAVALMVAIAASLSLVSHSTHRERRATLESIRVRYAAEGIAMEALARLRTAGLDALRTGGGFPRSSGDVREILEVTYGDADPVLADDLIRVVGIAHHDAAAAGVELYVRRTSVGNPALLAFGDQGTAFDSNSSVDSYDSRLGSWGSQAVNLRNGIPYAGSAAVVGSNGAISMGSNAQVFGDAVAGPGYSTTLQSNAWVSGKRSSASAPVALPPVAVPAVPSIGSRTIGSDQTVTIPAGTYHWTRFEALSNSRVTVAGPATVVIDDWLVDSNARMTFDTTAGPVHVYATGPVQVLSNAVVAASSGKPKDLRIEASGADRRIVLDSNAWVIAQIYAPVSIVELIGNAHLWGSVAARRLDMDSDGFLSVDVSLAASSGPTEYTFATVSWRYLANVR